MQDTFKFKKYIYFYLISLYEIKADFNFEFSYYPEKILFIYLRYISS